MDDFTEELKMIQQVLDNLNAIKPPFREAAQTNAEVGRLAVVVHDTLLKLAAASPPTKEDK